MEEKFHLSQRAAAEVLGTALLVLVGPGSVVATLTLAGKVTPAASDHPGVFRFSIETGMAGQWELVLTAAVPGEPTPITGKVIYNAK